MKKDFTKLLTNVKYLLNVIKHPIYHKLQQELLVILSFNFTQMLLYQ